jgi:hypothetical protein
LKDAAHAESLEHEVFQRPFKVEPEFEQWDTPSNYHRRNLTENRLPDKMKVWRVQNEGKDGRRYGGAVSRSYGYNDSPDAEVVVKGYNTGKEYGAVGVGRHGNVLQWGYWAPPSKMTEAGRKLFLNCICYIHKFDDKAPLIRAVSHHRLNTIRLAPGSERSWRRRKRENNTRVRPYIPDDITEKFLGDPNGLVQYYKDNIEFIYLDRQFRVDSELKSLGLDSNRSLESLERLVDFLNDETKADIAQLLLKRYTNQSFQDAEDWGQWFENNSYRIYFSDVGGYKFLVVPEGYLDTK